MSVKIILKMIYLKLKIKNKGGAKLLKYFTLPFVLKNYDKIKLWNFIELKKWNYLDWIYEIWDYCYIWNNFYALSSRDFPIKIWKFCTFADGVSLISETTHDYTKLSTYNIFLEESMNKIWAPISIWNDVRVWKNSIILKWVTIWTWAVIWAGSIVTHDVPPYAIMGWNPAKLIKYRFDKETINELLRIKWRDRDINKIRENYDLNFKKWNN